MSYLRISRTRTRERSPPPLRSIIRRNTKRSRLITLSDDEDDGHDDYPYSSHAVTIRNDPSQFERYNIRSDGNKRRLEHSRADCPASCRDDGDDHYYLYESRVWPSGMFFREKWVDEGWETCERSRSRSRSRGNSFWRDGGFWANHGRESGEEKWSWYRKIERTQTEERRALSGWSILR
jgi:hypothetical protein